MNKIKNNSKLTSRKSKTILGKPKITNINLNKNSTYKINPQSFRMTENDISVLKDFTNTIIKKTGKPYTASKVIRGLIHLTDNLEINLVLNSIDENT